MKAQFTIGFQLTALFIQTVFPAIPGFPPAWVPFVHALLAFCQTAQGIIAHYYTPGGGSMLPEIKITAKPADTETPKQ